jgi:hypothetical protein
MRQGRFKKHLISKDKLLLEAELIFPKIQELLKRSELFAWSHAELSFAYIIIYLDHRNKSILGGGRSEINQELVQGSLCYSQISDLLNKKWKKYLEIPLMNILMSHTLRGMPESINRVLVPWHLKTIELDLMFHIPSPMEVLKAQMEGARCVTMATKLNQLNHYLIESRDPLGFLVHDLEHADQFFLSPYRIGQIEFYQKISKVLTLIEENFNDQIFKEEFDYVISDMNSHPEHLKQYLKAKMISFNLRHNKNPEEGLDYFFSGASALFS